MTSHSRNLNILANISLTRIGGTVPTFTNLQICQNYSLNGYYPAENSSFHECSPVRILAASPDTPNRLRRLGSVVAPQQVQRKWQAEGLPSRSPSGARFSRLRDTGLGGRKPARSRDFDVPQLYTL